MNSFLVFFWRSAGYFAMTFSSLLFLICLLLSTVLSGFFFAAFRAESLRLESWGDKAQLAAVRIDIPIVVSRYQWIAKKNILSGGGLYEKHHHYKPNLHPWHLECQVTPRTGTQDVQCPSLRISISVTCISVTPKIS